MPVAPGLAGNRFGEDRIKEPADEGCGRFGDAELLARRKWRRELRVLRTPAPRDHETGGQIEPTAERLDLQGTEELRRTDILGDGEDD